MALVRQLIAMRLGAGLEPVAVVVAELNHVLHHGLVVVRLDREHALVPGRVPGVVDGALECGMERVETVLEHIGKAEDRGELGFALVAIGGGL